MWCESIPPTPTREDHRDHGRALRRHRHVARGPQRAGRPPTTVAWTWQIAVPAELGGDGEGTNPEQLFAAGYAAASSARSR